MGIIGSRYYLTCCRLSAIVSTARDCPDLHLSPHIYSIPSKYSSKIGLIGEICVLFDERSNYTPASRHLRGGGGLDVILGQIEQKTERIADRYTQIYLFISELISRERGSTSPGGQSPAGRYCRVGTQRRERSGTPLPPIRMLFYITERNRRVPGSTVGRSRDRGGRVPGRHRTIPERWRPVTARTGKRGVTGPGQIRSR